ncbi:MAG: hypothetical protein QOF86_1203 [Baekduia sp.]|nr:hypothetical protein [Baekduia sp.]
MQPLVSCLITTYNYGHLIDRAIDSALAQDYGTEHLEIVVVDDGSTDDTAEVLAPYLDRIRYVRKENGGLVSSVNRAIEEATGVYLAILDADDEWPPDKVSRQVAILEARPEVGLVYSDLETIDAGGAVLQPSYFRMLSLTPPSGSVLGAQLTRNYPAGGTMLFRASLVALFAPLDPALVCHDWPIANAIAEVAELEVIDAPLYRYRQHGANMNLGNVGASRRGIVIGENAIRRHSLSRVRPDQATEAELVEAVVVLDRTYEQIGGDLTAVVGIDEEQRAAAREALAEGIAARDAGERHTALTRLVNAVAHDPLSNDARGVLQALLNGEPHADAPAPFTVLAFADELLADPALLRAYCSVFAAGEPATLIIYGPGWDGDRAARDFPALLSAAQLDGPAPDLKALVGARDPDQERALAQTVRAVLSQERPDGAFAALPAFTTATAGQLRALAGLDAAGPGPLGQCSP